MTNEEYPTPLVPLPSSMQEEGGEPKPPEVFIGIGIVGVDENGIIVQTRFGMGGMVTIEEGFHYIFPNITNLDIVKATGGTVEIIDHKPTIKFADGTIPIPPTPPIKPPTTDERIKSLETTVVNLMIQGGMFA